MMGPDGLKEALVMLKSADPEERRQAVLALSGSGLPEAVAPVLGAVADSDWRVRKTAVEELVRSNPPGVFEGLYNHLFSGDNAGARNSACEALIKLGPGVVRALGERLSQADPDVRKYIVDIIGEIGDASGGEFLVRALDDEDANVRASAIEHIGRMRVAGALERLVAFLREGEQWTAFNAAVALGELGDGRAVPPLMEAARDPALREAALDALGRISDPGAWRTFVDALEDPVPVVREAAVKGLAAAHRASAEKDALSGSLRGRVKKGAVEFMVGSLSGDDKSLVRASAYVLGIMREGSAAGAIAGLLVDGDTRDEAVPALAEIAKDGPVPILPLLSKPEAAVRAAAASVLGGTGDAGVVDQLIPLLLDEDGHTRSAAATSLGRLGDRRAVEPLLGLLRDEYEDVQESAVRALGMLSGSGLTRQLKELTSDEDPGFRRNLAALIGLLDGPEAAGMLSVLMKDEEPEVRRTAVASLAGAESKEASRALFPALADEDPQVRLAAAGLLSKLGPEEAAGPLRLLLADKDPWVRSAAVRGLAGLVGEAAIESIRPLLLDPYVPVRITVVEAIGRLGTRECHEILKDVLETSGDRMVRDAARGFLGGGL